MTTRIHPVMMHDGGKEVGDFIISARSSKAKCLLCDGGAYSRTTYALLFAEIGTKYGAGDGVTTFNVPDARGRFPLMTGAGPSLTARAIGDKGGEETHLLTVGEMPAHNHGVTDPGHTHTGTVRLGSSTGGLTYPAGGVADNANYGVTISSAQTGVSIQNNGGGGAHNNMPPFIGLGNLFIYAGV